MASFLRVRNLERYQHYRDRNPPWVKLHREVLENYEFSLLPDASKAHALLMILLAARMENKIPNDPDWIAAKIGANSKVNVSILLKAGFLEEFGADCKQVASGSLADCKQVAMIEREGERETEKRDRERELRLPGVASAPPVASPSVLTFRTQGAVKSWDLTQAQVDRWQENYPGIDVLSSCRKALAWTEANGSKRKTAGGMCKFLVGWLDREVNSGRAVGRNDRNLEGLDAERIEQYNTGGIFVDNRDLQ